MKAKKTEIDITQAMTALLKQFRKSGFNGVRFSECYMAEDQTVKLKDWLRDGRTEAQYTENCANYCAMVITPDFDEEDSRSGKSKYVSQTVDWDSLQADLCNEIGRACGGDLDIFVRGSDISVMRRGYKWPAS